MLFLSRCWLEDLSVLFLVRKVDFLKLKILPKKLILGRKKKNQKTHIPQNHPYILQGKSHWSYNPAKKCCSFVEKDRNKSMLSQCDIIQLLNTSGCFSCLHSPYIAQENRGFGFCLYWLKNKTLSKRLSAFCLSCSSRNIAGLFTGLP